MERENVKISKALAERGFAVVRFLARVAYARSGNAHNPTKEWSYSVFLHGRLLGGGYSTLRAARELISVWTLEEGVED